MDAAVPGHDRADRFLDLGFLANVESVRLAAAAGRLDLALHGLQLLGLAAGDHDMRAERGKLVRRAAADAAAAAGHNHGLAGEQSRLEDRAIRHVSSAERPFTGLYLTFT